MRAAWPVRLVLWALLGLALALIVPLILRARGKGQVLSQLAGDED